MSSNRRLGRVFRPKYKDRQGDTRESPYWHIQYSHNGRRFRESTGTTVLREAKEILAQRLANKSRAIPQATLNRVRYAEIEQLILDDYELQGCKSLNSLRGRLKHLKAFFGGWKVVSITKPEITRYTKERLAAKASRATVNRELSALRRMFTLAVENGLARDVPKVQLLEEDNVREGVWDEDEVKRVLKHAPEKLHALIWTAYYTGWRRGELLSRRWRHVRWDRGVLSISKYETKEKHDREFPLIEQLHAVLKEQEQRKKEVERRTERIVTALFFHDDGRPIKDFRRAWKKALKAAGCEHRIFHDFRRTAISNFTDAGIVKVMAKQLSGHKTDSVFERYNIENSEAKKRAGEKLAAHLGAKTAKDRDVLAHVGGK